MSTGQPRKTKAERRDEAREARKQAEQNDAAAAAKKRRLWQLGGIVAIAAAIIIAIAVVTTSSDSGGGTQSGTPNGAAEITELFKGVPQEGLIAGSKTAPLTLVEFADMKCPVCQKFDVNAMPTLIRKYVKTGKLRIELRLLHFLDAQTPDTTNPGDSEAAARWVIASGQQSLGWNAAELFYYNQGDEATAYSTDSYLTWLGTAIPGLNSKQALAARSNPKITAQLALNQQQFEANGFTGTPSFLLGTTGGSLAPLAMPSDVGDASVYSDAIDAELNK